MVLSLSGARKRLSDLVPFSAPGNLRNLTSLVVLLLQLPRLQKASNRSFVYLAWPQPLTKKSNYGHSWHICSIIGQCGHLLANRSKSSEAIGRGTGAGGTDLDPASEPAIKFENLEHCKVHPSHAQESLPNGSRSCQLQYTSACECVLRRFRMVR